MTIDPSEHPAEILRNPPDEFYIPDAHGRIEQSAIYTGVSFSAIGEKDNAIVLTSQCDIQGSSANEFVLLARVISLEEFILFYLVEQNNYTEEEALGERAIESGKKKTRKTIISNLMSSYMKNQVFQYYFIPALNGVLEPSMITFDVTQCISIGNLETHSKVAVPRSPFREAVPSHYSAYIGRIGTPRLDKDYLKSVVESGCKIVDPA